MKDAERIKLMKIAIDEYNTRQGYELVLSIMSSIFAFVVYNFTGHIMFVFLSGMAAAWWLFNVIEAIYVQYMMFKVKDTSKIFKMIFGGKCANIYQKNR